MRFHLPPATSLAIVALGSALATGLGGAVALSLRRRADLLLGFSAGAVLGVAVFELLPEALQTCARFQPAGATLVYAAAGLVAYMAADGYGTRIAPSRFAPVALVGHSVLDGVGIGVAFHVSSDVGLVVAVGVMTHDLCDGANTVNLSLVGADDRRLASRWLIADALAPGAGILLSQLIAPEARLIGSALAVFAGALLYLGAGKLAVQGYRTGPPVLISGAILLGGAFIYAVEHLARA